MANKKKIQNKMTSEGKVRLFFVRAIAVWIFILPLIVHFKIVDVPTQMQDLYLREQVIDLFAYWKAVWLWIGASVFFVSAFLFRYFYKIGYKLNRFTGILLTFTVWIVITYIMSPYKNVAWFGYLDRYEGSLSWLSYCMVAYSVHTFAVTKEHGIIVIKGIVYSAGIVGLIGAFQFLQLDFFKTNFVKHLMLGVDYKTYANSLSFSLPSGQAYSTLYNPDYIGTFTVVCIPLSLFLFFINENRKNKIVFVLIMFLLLITLISSKSSGGIITLVCLGGIFLLYKAYRYIKKMGLINKIFKGALIGILVLCVLILGVLFINITLERENVIVKIESSDIGLQYFFDNGESLLITPYEENIKVYDMEGNEVKVVVNGEISTYSLADYEYKQRVLHFPTLKKVMVRYEIKGILKESVFDYFENDKFTILNRQIENNQPINVVKLFKSDKLFTNRGYIWNRTIPVGLNNPIFGYGSDTFPLAFPQVDLVDKWDTFGQNRIIVDKPHNLYLQLFVNFGIIGCVIILIYFLCFISKPVWVAFSFLGFFIISIVNDSIIASTVLIFTISALNFNESEKMSVKEN